MSLAGKVALITGSGRNIGRTIALTLAREGADIVVNARTNRAEADAVAAEVRALGRKAHVGMGDTGDRAQLEGVLNGALAEFGHIDIVVNNAASRPHVPFPQMTYEQWRGVMATDLDAAFITSRAAVPGMIERGWGRIINFSGLSAFQGTHGGAHISAAKVGMIGLTRSLSSELGHSGILVNCVVPGLIDTVRDDGLLTSAKPNARLANIPAGRMGTTEDIAELCAYLCSDRAGFITGQTFHVNGGERAY